MNPVESIIRQEILASGSISFARFMELALYCPKIGYYEHCARSLGRAGDFYTAVSVGPLFGELIGLQFALWLSDLRRDPPTIVEAGAHDGQLALDILKTLQRTSLVQYWIVEPSETLRQQQRAKLDVFAGQVTWFASLEEMPHFSGILFSNELLDALPVHVLRWAGGQWLERRIAMVNDQFVWRDGTLTTNLNPPVLSSDLKAVLPEGFQIEVSPAAVHWWGTAAHKLW